MNEFLYENYQVFQVFCRNKNVLLREQWYVDGALHRIGGPAETVFDEFGKKVMESYWLNGIAHRQDGPCQVQFDAKTGNVCSEIYKKNGLLHRDDGLPAIIRISEKNRNIKEERYCIEGVEHRVGGPSHIFYDEATGLPRRLVWKVNGYLTPTNGRGSDLEIDPKTGIVLLEDFIDEQPGGDKQEGKVFRIERDANTGQVLRKFVYRDQVPVEVDALCDPLEPKIEGF